MRQVQVSAILALVVACSGDNPADPADPLDVRVFPAHVFAGGEVFLAGEWYREIDQLPLITIDTFVLAVRRVDDSTLAVTLPTTVNGPITLRERVHNTDLDRAGITAHGLKNSITIPLTIETTLTPSWSADFPYIATGHAAGVSIINVRTSQASSFDDVGTFGRSASCPKNVGPTYRDETFLLWTPGPFPNNYADRWDLVPDTVRREQVLLPGCAAAELSPGLFVRGDQMNVTLDSIDGSGNFTNLYSDLVVQADRFFPSPDRTLLVTNGFRAEGTGVLDLVNRTLAYRVPAVQSVFYAAFSADGSRLFLLGEKDGADVLVQVEAQTGDSIDSRALDPAGQLAADPLAPLLYVTMGERDTVTGDVTAFLLILDQATLRTLGKVSIADAVCGLFCEETVLVVDRGAADLVLAAPAATGVQLVHFSLPPANPFPPPP